MSSSSYESRGAKPSKREGTGRQITVRNIQEYGKRTGIRYSDHLIDMSKDADGFDDLEAIFGRAKNAFQTPPESIRSYRHFNGTTNNHGDAADEDDDDGDDSTGNGKHESPIDQSISDDSFDQNASLNHTHRSLHTSPFVSNSSPIHPYSKSSSSSLLLSSLSPSSSSHPTRTSATKSPEKRPNRISLASPPASSSLSSLQTVGVRTPERPHIHSGVSRNNDDDDTNKNKRESDNSFNNSMDDAANYDEAEMSKNDMDSTHTPKRPRTSNTVTPRKSKTSTKLSKIKRTASVSTDEEPDNDGSVESEAESVNDERSGKDEEKQDPQETQEDEEEEPEHESKQLSRAKKTPKKNTHKNRRGTRQIIESAKKRRRFESSVIDRNNIRRSKRSRVSPLPFWQPNAYRSLQRRQDGEWDVITHEAEEDEEEKRAKNFRSRKYKKKKSSSKEDDGASDEDDQANEEEDLPPCQIINEDRVSETKVIAKSSSIPFEPLPQPALPGQGPIPNHLLPKGGKTFEEDQFSAGILILPPGGGKQLELANFTELFVVRECEPACLEVLVGENPEMRMSEGHSFYILPHNAYSLKNLSKKKSAKLYFTLIKPLE